MTDGRTTRDVLLAIRANDPEGMPWGTPAAARRYRAHVIATYGRVAWERYAHTAWDGHGE